MIIVLQTLCMGIALACMVTVFIEKKYFPEFSTAEEIQVLSDMTLNLGLIMLSLYNLLSAQVELGGIILYGIIILGCIMGIRREYKQWKEINEKEAEAMRSYWEQRKNFRTDKY